VSLSTEALISIEDGKATFKVKRISNKQRKVEKIFLNEKILINNYYLSLQYLQTSGNKLALSFQQSAFSTPATHPVFYSSQLSVPSYHPIFITSFTDCS